MMLSLRNFGLTQPNSRRKRAEGTGSEVLQSNTQRWDDLGFEHVGRMVPPATSRNYPQEPAAAVLYQHAMVLYAVTLSICNNV